MQFSLTGIQRELVLAGSRSADYAIRFNCPDLAAMTNDKSTADATFRRHFDHAAADLPAIVEYRDAISRRASLREEADRAKRAVQHAELDRQEVAADKKLVGVALAKRLRQVEEVLTQARADQALAEDAIAQFSTFVRDVEADARRALDNAAVGAQSRAIRDLEAALKRCEAELLAAVGPILSKWITTKASLEYASLAGVPRLAASERLRADTAACQQSD